MKQTIAPCLCLILAGCSGLQSSEGRDATQSHMIAQLGDVFLWTATAVYLIVVVLLVRAMQRGRRNLAGGGGLQGEPPEGSERGWRTGLIAFSGATAAIVFVLSLLSWWTDRGLARAAADPLLEIEITGHQWWWEVRYGNPDKSRMVHTANELHLPAGRTAHIVLKSGDVIHSLWIPNLAGKQDLIPGRRNELSLHPLRAGRFRSQCAEFCGAQHAHMALDVTVRSPEDFAAWYNAALVAPPVPQGGAAGLGYTLFQSRQCASCHTISGTPASGTVGPDLSHVASRISLASGTLPMTHVSFDRWLAETQKVKPGAQMPTVPLTLAERGAIVAYLETLK